jgi:hypothetical protein
MNREPTEDEWADITAIDPEEFAGLIIDHADARRDER